MKKLIIGTFLVAFGAFAFTGVQTAQQEQNFGIQKSAAITLRYDKLMSEKTIKAAVIDSYYRQICKGGKIIRWNSAYMPIKVYIEDSKNVPEYYREVVMNAYLAWQRASEGIVRFEFVEDASKADTKCYFKGESSTAAAMGVHEFSIKDGVISNSVITFSKSDAKGHSHDSKQLYSSALQTIGHSIGLTGASTSIYDVMYPVGTKFNTEITTRDLKTLALVYATIPDITNIPLTESEKSMLFKSSEILATLNVPVDDNTNLNEFVGTDAESHLALAEQLRKRAQYDKAAREYQIVAQTKTDNRSRSEVYYEVAVMYLDAEMFEDAKSAADIAWATDENDLTITLPPLLNYYMKRSNTAVQQLEQLLKENPYNKYAYKLLCQIYRDKHHENLLNSTIRRYGKTAGEIE